MKDTQPARVRLGVFELDLRSGDLRAGDHRTVLQEQPLQVLRMLVEREGELVGREEIRQKLWPNDTIVDFDHSINAAIKKLRRALADSAEEPKYIETVARRGYRLAVPVEWVGVEDSSGEISAGVVGAAVRLQPEPGLVGKKVSHYRVLQVIGAGGMGLVYKAEDLKLGRQVALKFLPEELATDSAALQRFQREAQTASSLNHPNICTIHEVEEHEAKPFIVMELLEGETLRDRLARVTATKKALPIEQLLDIAIQISAGLQAAHGKGIIHRDIKPANIFLTNSGAVKILDFGVAKLTTAVESVSAMSNDKSHVRTEEGSSAAADMGAMEGGLTRTGAAMGTAGYMSPEQVRGEKRTREPSLGLVLYEMATGRRAFTGGTQAVLHDAILNANPVPVHDLNSTLPPKLDHIIGKALEKDCARRYQSAADMRADLERVGRRRSVPRAWKWSAVAALAVVFALVAFWYVRLSKPQPASASVRRSVAVLGFKNLSGRPDLAWVSTALAEMLNTELASGDKLRTVPGEKIGQMKIGMALPDADSFSQETLARIGKNLSSDEVVVGSYIPLDGDQIRLDLRLQSTSGGDTLLVLSEKGSASQLDELATRAGAEVRQKLGAGEVAAGSVDAVRASFPRNPEAARLYSEGLNKLRSFDNLGARDLFEKSITIEPNFPLSHSALSIAWRGLGYDQHSKEEAKQAFDLSSGLPEEERLAVQAQYLVASKKWGDGADIYRTLLRQYPDNIEYGLHLAEAQTGAGAPKDALVTLSALRNLPPPLGQDTRIDLAEAIAQGPGALGDFKASIQAAAAAERKAEALGDGLLAANAKYWLGRSITNTGDWQQGLSQVLEAQRLYAQLGDKGGEALALTMVGWIYDSEDKLDAAMQATQAALKIDRQIGQGYNMADSLFTLGEIYDNQGHVERGIQTMEEALAAYGQVGNQAGFIQTQGQIGIYQGFQLRLLEGKLTIEREIALKRQYGRKNYLESGPSLSLIFVLMGDLPSAEAIAEQSLAQARELGSSQLYQIRAVAEVQQAKGDLLGARNNYEQVLTLTAKEQPDASAVLGWRRMEFARLVADEGRLDEAESLARRALPEIIKDNVADDESWATGVLADILLRVGKTKEAIQLAARADRPCPLRPTTNGAFPSMFQ